MHSDRKTALITGSGQNIGRGIASQLAQAGFNIIVNGSRNRDAAEAVAAEVREHGVDALVAMGNVGIKAEAEAVAKAGLDQFGGSDGLVNNAAIRPHGPFLEVSEDEWQQVMDVDLNAAIWLSRLILPGMIANGWGRIINLGTVGSTSPNSLNPGYYSAKGALATMTVSLAKEVAGTGVRVNLVSPGMILTPEVQAGYMQRGLEQGWGSNWDEIEAHVAKDIPIRRISRREEVAGLVAFLCGPQADAIHGQNIKMEGGQLGLVS